MVLNVPVRELPSRMRTVVPTGGFTPAPVWIARVPLRVATPVEVSLE